MTRCGHYFCTACAIKRNAKTPKCAACGTPTGGLFNRADKVIEKMNKQRKDKEDAEAAENGDAKGDDIKIEGLAERSEEEGESDEDTGWCVSYSLVYLVTWFEVVQWTVSCFCSLMLYRENLYVTKIVRFVGGACSVQFTWPS